MEDFEQVAFGTLKERKEGGNKGYSTMKRPAAASKKTAKPKIAAADSSRKNGYPGKGGPFGCVRCRGNVRGCASA